MSKLEEYRTGNQQISISIGFIELCLCFSPNVALDVSLDGEALVAVFTLELVGVGLVGLHYVRPHLLLSNLLIEQNKMLQWDLLNIAGVADPELYDSDPDPTYHFDAASDPDPTIQSSKL